MSFSSETIKLLSLVEERVTGETAFEAAFQITLQSFLQVCSEKKKKKQVNIIAKSAIQKLVEDLKVEEQYVQDIAMQMKRPGPVRGNFDENFAEKIVDIGWIEKKPNGELFYVDAWGNDQKVPVKDTFLNKFFPAWVEEVGGVDLLNTKMDQGFTHTNILCTGVEIDRLGKLSESMIISAHKAKQLYLPGSTLITSTADRGSQIVDALFSKKVCYFEVGYTDDGEANEDGKGLIDVDIKGDLLFHPKEFYNVAYGGLTFEQYVKKMGPFQYSLTIPEGNLKKASDSSLAAFGGRMRHLTGKAPYEYLADTTFAGQYEGESWMTLHEVFAFYISILSRYGILIDNDTITLVIGSYLKNKGRMPVVGWDGIYRLMDVLWTVPVNRDGSSGARSSVKKI